MSGLRPYPAKYEVDQLCSGYYLAVMAKAYDASFKDEVKALYLAGYAPSVIARQKDVKSDIVSIWAHRGNWKELRNKLQGHTDKAVVEVVNTGLQARGDAIRVKLIEEIECQVKLLTDKKPTKIHDLRNDNGLQGRSALAKSIIDSATVLFGWEDQKQPGLILVGELRRFDEGKVVDVEASLVVSGPTEQVPQ